MFLLSPGGIEMVNLNKVKVVRKRDERDLAFIMSVSKEGSATSEIVFRYENTEKRDRVFNSFLFKHT